MPFAPRVTRWTILIALLALPLFAQAELSAKVSERTRQKQAAEQERAELGKKLDALKEEIFKTEKARGHAADALAVSEAAISTSNRALRELAIEQAQTKARLLSLSASQEELEAAVSRQRAQLEKILRGQHLAGHDDRIRLLLSGDNPNRMSRELRYLGYVSAAQTNVIEALQANLAAIEANKIEAEEVRLSLEEIAQEQREQKALLEQEKAKHKTLVSQLSSKLGAQRKEAGNLARDEERLASLVERLAIVIAQQRKADEAAEAKKRVREAKEVASAREREASKLREKPTEKPAPAERTSKPPVKDVPRSASEASDKPATQAGETQFGSLRGKLQMPIKGELFASFGARRADGPSWKGLFIKAPEGAEVRAAAAGEVLFADWMRGFGNLLIVDHGGQYMTIYGNNQSVLKRPGDKVKTGDIIAAAGNSGGNEHSGLYFELRYQGRALDPLAWINR